MAEEIWKDIKGYEGLYQVSNLGRVKSFNAKNGRLSNQSRLLTPKLDRYGYLKLTLCKDKEYKYVTVHRLVALAFINNVENKPEVNHKDGNKLNNCVDNLEWMTGLENIHHAFDNELTPKTPLNNPKSIKISQYDLTGNFIKTFPSTKEVERQLGFSACSVARAAKSKSHFSHNFLWRYE